MKVRPAPKRRLFAFGISALLLLLPLQHPADAAHCPVQNKVVTLGVLDFSDESDTNAPSSLGRRLGQQLKQKLAAGFPDLLPKTLSQNSGSTATGSTVEQLVTLGKQNAWEFVVRPGMLNLASEDPGSLKAQLYAEVINVDSGQRTVVRAEGVAPSEGSTQGQSIQWNQGQGVTFANSAPGKALTMAIDQLASSIHSTLSATHSEPTASAATADAGSAEPSMSTATTPSETAAADVTATEADEEIQQLISQAEQFVIIGTGNTEQIKAVHSAMDQLKTALAAKAAALERGEAATSADEEISTQKQSLQAAIQALSEQAPQAVSGATESAPTSVEKKSLLGAIDQRAGEVIGILQKLQEMRSVMRGAAQDPSYNSGIGEAQPGAINEESTEEVSGVVTEGGQPLAGVTVIDTDTDAAVVTGADGSYSLKSIPGKLTKLAFKKEGKQIGGGQVELLRGHPAIADFEVKGHTANTVRVMPATVVLAGGSKSGPTGTLKGTANDKDGKPLARALVTLDDKSLARTDSQGNYSFLKVPTGEHVVTVRKSGLKVSSTRVQVAANQVSNSRVALTRDPLTNKNDSPYVTKVIAARSKSASPAPATRNQQITRNKLAERSDRPSRVLPVTAEPARQATNQRLGQLRGHVIDAASVAPIAGAVVAVSGRPSVMTARDGSYSLSALPPGSYQVSISRPGFSEKRTTITIRAAETTNADVRLTAINRKPSR